jgi:hypothetical protein
MEIYVGSITKDSLVLTSVPGMYNSGVRKVFRNYAEVVHTLRSYLVEAAWIAIRKDTEMQNYWKHQGKNVKVSL